MKFIFGGKYRCFILPITPTMFIFAGKSVQFVRVPNIGSLSTIDEIFFNRQYALFAITINQHLMNNPEAEMAVFDLGANIGLFEVFLRQNLPRTISIYCFEPAKSNFSYLTNNVSQNTILTNRAVSSSELKYTTSADEGDDVKIIAGNENLSEVAISFEKEFYEKKRAINFVKIDIEGHEYDLFQENTRWLNDLDLLAVEFHDNLVNRNTSGPFIKSLKIIKYPFRMFFNDNMIWIKRASARGITVK